MALAAGGGMAVLWIAVFLALGMYLGLQGENFPLDVSLMITPNPLLAGLAGGLIGWIIWRVCGRTCNRTTIIVAVIIAAAVPLLSTLLLAGITHFELLTYWPLILRLLLAVVISAAFSLVLTTQLHWSGTVHLDE